MARVLHHDGNLYTRWTEEGKDGAREHAPEGLIVGRVFGRENRGIQFYAFWTEAVATRAVKLYVN